MFHDVFVSENDYQVHGIKNHKNEIVASRRIINKTVSQYPVKLFLYLVFTQRNMTTNVVTKCGLFF